MLQQTQVSRVLIKYPEFLRRFPSLQSLARARQSSVVRAWSGMGYNNRAVRLHRLAKVVMREHGGRIPESREALAHLPGVGRYTVHAIRSSAFGAQEAIVDVNVRRVLSRLFWRMPSTEALRNETEIWTLAEFLLPRRRAYPWNQTLMDFGATVCTARSPVCTSCPVRAECASAGRMDAPRRSRKGAEPSWRGIPNRIHRGRIIQRLREADSRGISRNTLHRSIPGNAPAPWFHAMLNDLERDGLIRLRASGRRIHLA